MVALADLAKCLRTTMLAAAGWGGGIRRKAALCANKRTVCGLHLQFTGGKREDKVELS